MVRFGILGAARIARAMFQSPLDGVEFIGIASGDRHKADQFGDEYHIPRRYGSYDTLLDDPDIDAVYIPLPQHLHKEYTIKAAERGKHVLVEKPAALSSGEIGEMESACRAAGVLFMEAFMYRFMRMPNRVKEIVQSGWIGPLRYIDFNFCFDIFTRGRTGYRLERSSGGGALYDLGIYGIDFLRFITGGEPDLVHVLLQRRQPEDIDVFTHAILQFGGAVGAMTCAFNCDANYYTVCGEHGKIFAPVGISGRLVENFIEIHHIADDAVKREYFPAENPYKWEIEYFARCIQNGEEPFLGFGNSKGNFAMLDKIFLTGE